MTPLQSVVKPEVHEVVMDELHGIVVISYEAPHVFAISSTALKNAHIIVHDVGDAEAARSGPKIICTSFGSAALRRLSRVITVTVREAEF